MLYLAIKMLIGDRAKYIGLVRLLSHPMRAKAAAIAAKGRVIERVFMMKAPLKTASTFSGDSPPV